MYSSTTMAPITTPMAAISSGSKVLLNLSIQSVVSVFLPAYVDAIAFVIFVLVLLVRPWGILGERNVEKL